MSELNLALKSTTFHYPIKNLVLSHSGRSSFRRCARLLEFGKLYGDGSDREEMFAAECGKALHVGFQSYLIDRDEISAIFKFIIAYPHELEFGQSYNQARSLEACYITLMELINSPIVDRYELIHIKTQLPELKDEEGNIIREKHCTLPAIEVPFAISIANAPIPIPTWFVGFIDAILYDRVDEQYLVCDIKTTRMNIADYSTRYEFDEQCVPYGIVLEYILGTKIDEFKVSYLSAFIDLLEPKVSIYKFTKTQDHIHDWYRGLCEDIGRICRYFKAKWFPRATNGETCFSFNKPCWFADYCSHRDPEIIERMVGGVVRDGLFHDNQEPWVVATLEWKEV